MVGQSTDVYSTADNQAFLQLRSEIMKETVFAQFTTISFFLLVYIWMFFVP